MIRIDIDRLVLEGIAAADAPVARAAFVAELERLLAGKTPVLRPHLQQKLRADPADGPRAAGVSAALALARMLSP